MKLQVLMSIMNQDNHDIIKHANLQTDAIIINQSEEFKNEIISYNGSSIQFLTFSERGVGLSRNNALMRSNADIVIMADDDIRYIDDYEKIVLDEFKKNPKADMIMFNLPSTNPDRPSADNETYKRIRRFNSLKYGTYRMAFRLDSIRSKNLYFSLLFGGGAKYSSGEDSLFIYSALQMGLKIFAVPIIIGYVSHQESTWFKGYTNKFFQDKGVLFYSLSKGLYLPLIFQFVIRKHNEFSKDKSVIEAFKLMLSGVAQYKKIYEEKSNV